MLVAWSVFPLTLVVPGSFLYSATLWIFWELCLLLWALLTHLIDLADTFPRKEHRQVEENSPHQSDTHNQVTLLFQFFYSSPFWDDISRAHLKGIWMTLPVSHLRGPLHLRPWTSIPGWDTGFLQSHFSCPPEVPFSFSLSLSLFFFKLEK